MPTLALYKVLDTTQLMGNGGIDYVYADNGPGVFYVPARRRHVLRSTWTAMNTSAITNIGGHGVDS